MEALAEQRAAAALQRLGFRTEEGAEQLQTHLPFDLSARRSGLVHLVVVKEIRSLSLSVLAEPLLRLQALADAHHAAPLLVLLTDRPATEQLADRFERRLQAYRVSVSWLVVDPEGGVVGSLAGEGAIRQGPDRPPRPHTGPPPRGTRISFTDHEQWLLKRLLLGDAPPSTWWSDSPDPAKVAGNANQLAAVTDTSPATCYRLVRSLVHAGYASRPRWGTMRVDHPEALLEEWTGRYRLTDNRLLPYGPDLFALPRDWRGEILRRLKSVAARSGYAVTGHAACEHTEMQRARATISLHIYVERTAPDLANLLDLVPEPQARGRDIVYLIVPANPLSVFRGATIQNQLSVVDPLQCYLDLYHQHEGGREQADFLLDRLIRPRLEAALTQ